MVQVGQELFVECDRCIFRQCEFEPRIGDVPYLVTEGTKVIAIIPHFCISLVEKWLVFKNKFICKIVEACYPVHMFDDLLRCAFFAGDPGAAYVPPLPESKGIFKNTVFKGFFGTTNQCIGVVFLFRQFPEGRQQFVLVLQGMLLKSPDPVPACF